MHLIHTTLRRPVLYSVIPEILIHGKGSRSNTTIVFKNKYTAGIGNNIRGLRAVMTTALLYGTQFRSNNFNDEL